MISPRDEDYVETKLIKLGKRRMVPVLEEIATLIASEYAPLTVLNVRYDRVPANSQPRLTVIFEFENERRKFLVPGQQIDFDPVFVDAITKNCRAMLEYSHSNAFDAHDLCVTFAAFEPVARVEANWSITAEQISQMEKELEHHGIWKILPEWEGATFFFYTNQQLEQSEGTSIRQACVETYVRTLSKFDEFGYFERSPLIALYDSKENFEAKFKGNWFYYSRR